MRRSRRSSRIQRKVRSSLDHLLTFREPSTAWRVSRLLILACDVAERHTVDSKHRLEVLIQRIEGLGPILRVDDLGRVRFIGLLVCRLEIVQRLEATNTIQGNVGEGEIFRASLLVLDEEDSEFQVLLGLQRDVVARIGNHVPVCVRRSSSRTPEGLADVGNIVVLH